MKDKLYIVNLQNMKVKYRNKIKENKNYNVTNIKTVRKHGK